MDWIVDLSQAERRIALRLAIGGSENHECVVLERMKGHGCMDHVRSGQWVNFNDGGNMSSQENPNQTNQPQRPQRQDEPPKYGQGTNPDQKRRENDQREQQGDSDREQRTRDDRSNEIKQ